MFYVDTSVIVAALTNEPATDQAHAWLLAQPAGEAAISDWTLTEFSSALAIKLRTGQLTMERRATSMTSFSQLLAESFVIFSVTSTHFRTAAHFASQHGLGLRASDALHLAVASASGSGVVTFDHRLAAAALELGISVIRP